MKPLLQPWQPLLLILAGWINHREQDVIEYLRAGNRVLREKLGKKRILLNDDQRWRLAVIGKILGRQMLEQVAMIVTPDTILHWHRELVAAKRDCSGRRKKIGRPSASAEVVELLLRMARENQRWGYDRIQGGLVTVYLLFGMELATRRVHFADSTANPDKPWMLQVSRNLSDAEDGFLRDKKYLLMDRDTNECARVSTPSISAEIPTVSRFQSTMCCSAAGRPSFFTSRTGDNFIGVEFMLASSACHRPQVAVSGS